MSEILTDDFVCEYKNVIDPFLCKEIIKLFEYDNNKQRGHVLGGVVPNVKNTIDLQIGHTNPLLESEWTKVKNLLIETLDKCVNKYYKSVNADLFKDDYRDVIFFQYDGFLIQKYIKNEGLYTYHNDFHYQAYRYRLLTFIFYLNTIDNGGETEFKYGKYKIKPEAGKLVLFPASWTYPHCGKMPFSDNKYIITGWLYNTDNSYVIDQVNELARKNIL